MEKNYKIESVENLRSGLGLGVNAGHSISVVGRKAAAFTDRIKNAISTNYHKAVNAMKAKAAAARDAVVNKAGEIKDAAAEKATHVMNSVDAHAYHLAQEDFQKIMSKKTAQLDEKIEKIQNKMVAIKNAKVGLGKDQVKDEKDRTYLLHKSSELLNKYTTERNAIATETMQLENYEKGQNEKIKISGKRRLLIGALDLKRIVTNVAKATLGVGVAVKDKISGFAKNAKDSMQEKMAQRKLEKEARKAAEEEAKKAAELANMSTADLLNEMDPNEFDAIEEYADLVNQEILNTISSFNNSIAIENKKAEIAKNYPQAAQFVETSAEKDFTAEEKELRSENKRVYDKVNQVFLNNPQAAIDLISSYEKQEEKQAKEVEKANEEAYNRGKADGIAEMKAKMKAMRKQMEELQKQIASMSQPAKEKPDYGNMKKDELLKFAKEKGVEVTSSMKKADIINSLNSYSKEDLMALKEGIENNKQK